MDDNSVKGITTEERRKQNKKLLDRTFDVFSNSEDHFSGVRKKIMLTYKVTLGLYMALFALGFLLLLVPVIAALQGDVATYNSLLSGSLGIINLVVLFMFKPVEKIHDLMSELSQLTIITNSYQEQEALILYEFDATDKESIKKAIQDIKNAAMNSVLLLEKFCESQSKKMEISWERIYQSEII